MKKISKKKSISQSRDLTKMNETEVKCLIADQLALSQQAQANVTLLINELRRRKQNG